MGSLLDLGINLLAALIGFLVARLVARVVRERRNRSTRRMWAVFDAPHLSLVVSPWQTDRTSWEPTGLLATSDVRALLALQRSYLAIGRSHEVVEAGRLHGASAGGDLVLIGGPVLNRWTRSALEALAPGVRFHEDGGVVDAVGGRTYAGSFTEEGQGVDTGMVVMGPSPFAPGRSVLILAGHHSYGTHAAARLVTDSIDDLIGSVRPDRPFEIVFSTRVVNGDPQRPTIELARNVERA